MCVIARNAIFVTVAAITAACSNAPAEPESDASLANLVTNEFRASPETLDTFGVATWVVEQEPTRAFVRGLGTSGQTTESLIIEAAATDGEASVKVRNAATRESLMLGPDSRTAEDYGESRTAGLLTALRWDTDSNRGAAIMAPAEPSTLTSGLAPQATCGTGHGPCTTRTSISCAFGPPGTSLCITNEWLFRYPYANGCTGETGTGFCFW